MIRFVVPHEGQTARPALGSTSIACPQFLHFNVVIAMIYNTISNIKTEMNYITIDNNVILSLDTHLALFFGLDHSATFNKVRV